jgi:hypothetical protein
MPSISLSRVPCPSFVQLTVAFLAQALTFDRQQTRSLWLGTSRADPSSCVPIESVVEAHRGMSDEDFSRC